MENIKKVQDVFNVLYTEVNKHARLISQSIFTEIDLKSSEKIMSLMAKAFRKTIKDFKIFNRQDFIDRNAGQLYRINSVLVGYFAKLFLNNQQISHFISLHNIIFKSSLIILKPSTYFKSLATIIFNKFVKGITYFSNDDVPQNIVYHREQSCGSKTKSVAEKFSEKISQSDLDKLRIKSIVRICYIERLIYDKIFFTVFHFQDPEHLIELRKMEIMYDKYFPFENIYVDDVHFTDEKVYPEKVTITTRNNINIQKNRRIHKEMGQQSCVLQNDERWCSF